ncbi:MAG: DinB family protein [Gemmatimonadota bacterium]|nr:MAG: DinB family protein [Gemmatimonadota bacterium]
MDWSELLNAEIETTYGVTEKLFDLVDDDDLDWKPGTGSNWMTMGQLLNHIGEACGMAFRGFVTGDWGLPEGQDLADLSPEEMLPPADAMPTIGSVREAREKLGADKQLALAMLAKTTAEGLDKMAAAPWDPTERSLGHRLLQMVDHLKHHKAQLFYYLKLQGMPVNTAHLWGM